MLSNVLARSSTAALGGLTGEARVAAALEALQPACGLRVGLVELRALLKFSFDVAIAATRVPGQFGMAPAALREAYELFGSGARYTALGATPGVHLSQHDRARCAASAELARTWLAAERALPRPDPGVIAELAASQAALIAMSGRTWRYADVEPLVAESRAALARSDLPQWRRNHAEGIKLQIMMGVEALESAKLARPDDYRTAELPNAATLVSDNPQRGFDALDRARRRGLGAPCGACGIESRDLKACAACKGAFYCSRECQRAAWPAHKDACRAAAAARAAARAP